MWSSRNVYNNQYLRLGSWTIEQPSAELTSFIPYIRDSVRKFTAGPTKPKFTWWRVDAYFIVHHKCLFYRMACKDNCVSTKHKRGRRHFLCRVTSLDKFNWRRFLSGRGLCHTLYTVASGSRFRTEGYSVIKMSDTCILIPTVGILWLFHLVYFPFAFSIWYHRNLIWTFLLSSKYVFRPLTSV